MAANHSKIRVANRQWRSHFPRRWRNQNTKRKTESYEFSGFRILSIGINSITVDFAYWELRPAKKGLFCCDSTHVFILSAPTHFTNFIWGLSILLFSIINKVDFSCQWRTIVFIWQKKNVWLLVDMKFLFSCSAHSWAIELKTQEKFHIYARVCIILYLLSGTAVKFDVLFTAKGPELEFDSYSFHIVCILLFELKIKLTGVSLRKFSSHRLP